MCENCSSPERHKDSNHVRYDLEFGIFVQKIRETSLFHDEINYSEMEVKYCPVCGRKLG